MLAEMALERFVIDKVNAIVFARVVGYLDEAMVAHMVTISRQAARQLGKDFGRHSLLYDLAQTQVASTAAIDTVCRMMSDPASKPLWAHRVGFFAPSALLRLQMQRICAVRPGIAMFDDRRSAIAWIQSERAGIAA